MAQTPTFKTRYNQVLFADNTTDYTHGDTHFLCDGIDTQCAKVKNMVRLKSSDPFNSSLSSLNKAAAVLEKLSATVNQTLNDAQELSDTHSSPKF